LRRARPLLRAPDAQLPHDRGRREAHHRSHVHAFDPDDIARLATLAIDESGRPEDTAAVGELFDRMGARVSTIAQAMFDPLPATRPH
jgi:hypothetical protein